MTAAAVAVGRLLGPDRVDCPVVAVPLQLLRFHPRNIRSDLGDLSGLVASIREEGVLVPLMAQRRGNGGLVLLHGHRRWAAADMVGLRKVPCTIVPEHTDDQAILVMLAENTGRLAPDAAGLQGGIRALVDEFGYSPAAIAKRLGVARSVVEDWGSGRSPQTRRLAGRVSPDVAPRAGRTPRAPSPWVPKVGPKVVHAVLARRDAGELDDAGVVAQLREVLAGWEPKTPPARAGGGS